MSIFNKLFGKTETQTDTLAAYTAGRYTDINKSKKQTEAWEQAKKEFGEKNYIESYYNLFMYLNDPAKNSVTVNRSDNSIEFTLEQGSKMIKGIADNERFVAETRIASFETLNIAFLRKLMNMNYALQYCRFAIKDNDIYLKLTSKTLDASPNKLYYSLKELALKADKLDDALINEFAMLKPIDVNHIQNTAASVRETRYKYLKQWIETELEKASKLNEDHLAGGISYLLLALLYRIDYLLVPQGRVLNDIEKINGIFYNPNENISPVERNRSMTEEFKKLAAVDKEILLKEFYDIKATFGYVSATSHKTFYEFVLEQFKNTGWYYDNKHPDVVTAIYEYIMGYAMFSFGLYPATIELIQLINNVLHNEFFKEMGLTNEYYSKTTGKFNIPLIEKEIQRIMAKHRSDYPKLSFTLNKLGYTNMNEFLYTALNEITYLNFSK
ncbi:MAG TPA: hypothetical protein PLP11_04930 [Bacteroidales bacterium]|nr:hypothetical protein [Bacteroidales bacterium]HQP03929.1 hypothetical protein [Bacteroidales bacterium]